ncbi:hypothetical protein [Streptomyces prasinopilosus]|uniref:Uncharacterized protein n=1 Tax=Streptomyces prasinopilosus TaxID=67344 RepID=A0A1G6NXV3_9ACTN|nr:hypothetical protein [Streptomyces prasinopilosus]SDC72174.1 hypothetical protein SAMN05216505_103290 [Streptomyces prasinopilosus]
MSLVELIARADERALAASGMACLDRCVPLLGGDDETLRPLWGSLAEDAAAGEWAERLEQVRGKLDAVPGADGTRGAEAAALAHRMLTTAPAERSAAALREWAHLCSVTALRIHRILDGGAPDEDVADAIEAARAGRTAGLPLSPLGAAELRRQTTVLEVLAGHGPAGLRRALEVSTEGRRVLAAALSRRNRRDG